MLFSRWVPTYMTPAFSLFAGELLGIEQRETASQKLGERIHRRLLSTSRVVRTDSCGGTARPSLRRGPGTRCGR